ncbi:hypothetical protein ABL78_3483 [Leptomonas seymouri]|uniref:Uncharacterized protein n=1 Tax=Leptomonas seymouri TaxID=5684 RepID=A0A0N1HXW7_LEPSE|nr:hypothetical protein ABL78_3483 [Leptomonas seymouri]|eukprot:KPI87452.1 hypothetical protein ABL78_3483 [Leptomonas seymouri]
MATTGQTNTFTEAGVALHSRLLSAVQAAASAATGTTSTTTNSNLALITPTPLLIRVLRRTVTDFADVIVDGRCATGSRQVGSAAAVWIHHNTAMRSAGGTGTCSSTTSPSTAVVTSAAGGPSGGNSSGAPSPLPSSPVAAAAVPTAAASNGSITPLYYTEAALNECRSLLALYSLHCLLTVSQLYNSGVSNVSQHVHAAADGRVRQLPVSANHWAPEVSIIVAESETSAEELLKLCRALAAACNCGVQVSMVVGNKAPPSLILRPTSVATTSPSAAAAAGTSSGGGSGAGGKDGRVDAEANKKDEVKKKGAEYPYAASIIITTTQSFLSWSLSTLLNTGVDVAMAEEGGSEADSTSKDGSKDRDAKESKEKENTAVRTKRVFPHIVSIVVEEIGQAIASGTAASEKALQQWRDVHATFNTAMPRQHTRYCAPAHLLPHVMWVCRGPVSRLPVSLRQLLSRRSRRYYQLQPSTYISPAAVSLLPQPQEGLSMPAKSLGLRLVLSQSIADKDAQLRRIVTDCSGLYHRVLILTHNKEVPQLSALIASWGVTPDRPSSSSTNSSAAQPATDASPILAHATRRMDSAVAQQQCHTSFLCSCEAAERAVNAGGSNTGDDTPSPSPVVVSLVAWDVFTALDVMDVDVIVQYYPPQKSLTEQEWAEFIQLLHTTINGEREIELSLRQNRNNKEDNIRAKLSQLMQCTTTGPETPGSASLTASPSRAAPPHRPLPVLVTLMVAADFTLTAYFLHQYLYSGASGSLTQAATASSLASIAPIPGKPGVQEPVEHPIPVLDISPKHPYFIPLVCGHDGGAGWPEGAAGSLLKARVNASDSKSSDTAPLLTHFISGEVVSVRNVLVAKLAKEQSRPDTSKSSLASSTNSPITTNTVSPALLLSQGNASTGGTNGGAGGKGSASGAADGNSNVSRLLAKNGMSASSCSNQNSNGAGGGNNARSHVARDAAGSSAEANAGTASTSGGSGGKGSGNAQRSNNNHKGNNRGGSGHTVGSNNNNSTTTSSSAAAAAAAGSSSGGQADSKSLTTAATSLAAKPGNGEKGGGDGSGKRRQRNSRGNNSSKKAAAQTSS